jgi:hypothetical protein
MALLVLLVPSEHSDVLLQPAALEALADLGVTSVALARDERTAAYILEGWAFDPGRDGAAVTALGARAGAAALQPVVEMAVSAAAIEGGVR